MNAPKAEPLTVFGGTLIRKGRDHWEWSDGRAEPRVRDAEPDRFHFEKVGVDGELVVKVPNRDLREEPVLCWIFLRLGLDFIEAEEEDVILVPEKDWNAWLETLPTGATWKREDEPALRQRASDLGWKE